MTREIKFRVWVKDENFYIGWEELENYSIADVFTNPNYEIEQSTGLEDSNGEEIYDNDLVNTDFGIKKVSYHEGKYFPFSFFTFAERTTVVGNIHENPELLSEN